MRHRFPRVSASVAAIVAVLAAFVLTASRESDDRARHSALRTTRGAVQRLDGGEALTHGFDDPEPVMSPAADGIGDFTTGVSAAGTPTAAIAGERPAFAPDVTLTLGSASPTHSRALARPHRPSLGRAPPVL